MTTEIDFETQLQTVPVRNARLKLSRDEKHADALIVEVELRYRGMSGLIAPLVKARNSKRYELVGLSRELFERLDGKLRVEDLIDSLSQADKLTFFEARALVTLYLKDLMQRGLIVILPDAVTADTHSYSHYG